MLEPELGDFQGLPALRRFAAEVGAWPEEAEDSRWCAAVPLPGDRAPGTGGGNFRLMYSRFLAEVGYDESALAAERPPRRGPRSPPRRRQRASPSSRIAALWAAVGAEAATVLEAEERLWDALAASAF